MALELVGSTVTLTVSDKQGHWPMVSQKFEKRHGGVRLGGPSDAPVASNPAALPDDPTLEPTAASKIGASR